MGKKLNENFFVSLFISYKSISIDFKYYRLLTALTVHIKLENIKPYTYIQR
jgi:hypothetical protein